MSTKFEQLLDYLVNEEMDKANELFHEIVVEKSREIYENMISEEVEEDVEENADEEVEESADEEVEENADEEIEEGMMDDSMEMEDSFPADDQDPSGDFGSDVDAMPGDEMPGDEMPGDEMPGDDSPEAVKDEIEDVVQQLTQILSQLDGGMGDDDDSEFPGVGSGDEFDSDDEEEPDDSKADETMGVYEGKKRMTREYVEKVGNDWNGNNQKAQGKAAGADTGDKMGNPSEGKSPISSGKGKPTTGATAGNILGDKSTGEGTNVGTKPTGKTGGLVKNPQTMNTGNQNVPGGKVSVKGLTKVTDGHGAEKKGSGPGPVGSGSGDKAGQTSVQPVKQFLKPYSN